MNSVSHETNAPMSRVVDPVNSSAPGMSSLVPKTVYLDFVKNAHRDISGLEFINLNIPSYQFQASAIEDYIAEGEYFKSGYEKIHNFLSKRTGTFAFTTTCMEIDVVYIIRPDDGNFELFTKGESGGDRWVYRRPEHRITGNVVVACLMCEMLATRHVTYVEDTGPDISRINLSRAKRGKQMMPVPKIIKLTDVRTVGRGVSSQSTGQGSRLTYSFEVPTFTRHYKKPIKSGANAGKTEVMVSSHIRGRGLPPKPKTAEYMQHRVVR